MQAAGVIGAVCYHAPVKPLFPQFAPAFGEILAQTGLPSGDGNDDALFCIDRGKGHYRVQKIVKGHIFALGARRAVRAAVDAMQITAPGTFPEQVF